MNLIKRVFSLDLRSIALFRIALASLILIDLLLRSQDLTAFYTDDGVLPRRLWMDLTNHWYWSLHAASGDLWWQIVLFIVAALFALALLFGYRSKLAAIGSFILLASLLNRNVLLLQGGDQLLVIMCFWSLFLPLGARFSIDSALQPALAKNPNTPLSELEALRSQRVAQEGWLSNASSSYFSMATVAIVFQILYLYSFTAILKSGDAWVLRSDAAFYAVSLQHFATPIADWLRHYPALLKLATIYVLAVEKFAPLLVLCPFFWPWARIAGLLLLASLHVAFVLMLHIGLFPFIDFMALSLLIPGSVWFAFQRWPWFAKRREKLSTVKIYYDEDCGFCLKMCLILRTFLLPDEAQILPAQHHADIYPIMQRENTWVVTGQTGETYTHWRAMTFLFCQRWPFKPIGWIMSIPPFMAVGNVVYRWVADNRSLMSTLSNRILPYRQVRITPTKPGFFIAALFFAVVTAYNLYGLPQIRSPMPTELSQLARTFRLDQKWDMFAPYPLTTSSYVLIPGTLRNGEQIDLYPLTSSAADWQPPYLYDSLFDGYRWRKYLGRVNSYKNNAIRKGLGNYYCKQWNSQPRSRETQLATFEIYYVKHRTNTEGKPKEQSKHKAWRHWCYQEFANP